MTTESENIQHRAGTQRTFHVHVFAGSDRASNQFMILIYLNYRLIHAETQNDLEAARYKAASFVAEFGDAALIKIIDEHGTEHEL